MGGLRGIRRSSRAVYAVRAGVRLGIGRMGVGIGLDIGFLQRGVRYFRRYFAVLFSYAVCVQRSGKSYGLRVDYLRRIGFSRVERLVYS